MTRRLEERGCPPSNFTTMKKKLIADTLEGCAPIAAGFIIAAIFCFALLLCGCKAQKEIQVERVEVPVVVTQEHTVESVKIDHVRDTLIQRDSIYHYVKGDTVIIEKWHHTQGQKIVTRVDTLHVYDSVPYPVRVDVEKFITKTEEVEKPLSWWQKARMGLGTIFIILLAVAAMFGGMMLYGKIMKR